MSAPASIVFRAAPVQRRRGTTFAAFAGIGGIAFLCMQLAILPALAATGLSALTLAIVLGLLAGNLGYARFEGSCAPAVHFARHSLLRAGIVLYGSRITFQALEQLGAAGILIPLVVLAATLLFGTWAGIRWFGLSREQALLVAAGSAICGAAAVLAAAPAVKAEARETGVAVATVVLFGTVAMFLYPAVHGLLAESGAMAVSAHGFGVYIGSTLHEVAQVVAAAQPLGGEAADAAVLAKMVRVLALGPVLIVIALWHQSGGGAAARPGAMRGGEAAGAASIGTGASRLADRASPPARWSDGLKAGWKAGWKAMPWFAVGFVLVIALNSAAVVPAVWMAGAQTLGTWLLACAMFAIGLGTRIEPLLRAGRRPMLLGGLLLVFLVLGGAAINGGINALAGFFN